MRSRTLVKQSRQIARWLMRPNQRSTRFPRGIARPLRQPNAALGKFVGGIVMDDKVDIVGRRNVLIDLIDGAREGTGLLMTVAGLQAVITVPMFRRQNRVVVS